MESAAAIKDLPAQLLALLPVNGTAASRHESIARIQAMAPPSTFQEDWKYTDVLSFFPENIKIARSDSGFDPEDHFQLILDNGQLLTAESNDEIRIDLLSNLTQQKQKELKGQMDKLRPVTPSYFLELNSALYSDCTVVEAKAGARQHVRVLFYSDGQETISFPRLLVVADKNAEIELSVEILSSSTHHVTVPVIQVITGENSSVRVNKLQDLGNRTIHIGHDMVYLHQSSRFIMNTASFGGRLIRNSVYCALPEREADCKLFGIYLPAEGQHIDNRTVMDHISPDCTSDEFYKGVLNGNATGVFNGKVFVRQGAQKTNAFQRNQNILLSSEATINSKPELEIYADDVKCSHGSTTGQFDEEAIFYLRSRGIPEITARKLLVKAFAGDIIAKIADDTHRQKVEALLEHTLQKEG